MGWGKGEGEEERKLDWEGGSFYSSFFSGEEIVTNGGAGAIPGPMPPTMLYPQK